MSIKILVFSISMLAFFLEITDPSTAFVRETPGPVTFKRSFLLKLKAAKIQKRSRSVEVKNNASPGNFQKSFGGYVSHSATSFIVHRFLEHFEISAVPSFYLKTSLRGHFQILKRPPILV